MKQTVLVIGLGRFGTALSLALNERGTEVIAVDIDRHAVDRVKDVLDHVVQGDIRDRAVIQDLCRNPIDVAVLAFGDKIDQSVLATLYLKEIGVPRIIARANSDDYAQVLTRVGADRIIRPIKDAAQHLAGALASPSVVNFVHLGEDFAVLEYMASAAVENKTIRTLDWPRRFGVVALGIKPASADGTERHSVEAVDPDRVIRLGDRILLAGRTRGLEALQADV